MSLEQKITETITTYIASFETKDVDTILSLFAEDAWIEDPVGTEKKVGHAALREFYEGAVAMDLKGTLDPNIRIAGNEAAFAFCMEVDLGTDVLKICPIDVMTFNDAGKVTTMRAFFSDANQTITPKA